MKIYWLQIRVREPDRRLVRRVLRAVGGGPTRGFAGGRRSGGRVTGQAQGRAAAGARSGAAQPGTDLTPVLPGLDATSLVCGDRDHQTDRAGATDPYGWLIV